MSNNAFINFLFNSQGATRDINIFKNDFVQAIQSMTSTATQLLSGFGDILGNTISPKQYFKDIMEMRRVSEAYKTPIEQISKMNNLLHIFGGNTQDTIGLIENMGSSIAQVLKGQNADYFGKFGIEVTDATGRTKNPVQILQDIRNKYQSMNAEGQQALLSHFGLAGNKAIVEYLSAEENYLSKFTGLVDGLDATDKETSDRMKRISDSMGTLSLLWNNTYTDLSKSPIGDLIDRLSSSITDYATSSPENAEKIKKIMMVLQGTGFVINQLPRYIPLFKALKSIPSTGGVVALGVALGYLAYEALGGYEGIDKLLKKWQDWINEVTVDYPIFGSICQFLKEAFEWLVSPYNQIQELYTTFKEMFNLTPPKWLESWLGYSEIGLKSAEALGRSFVGNKVGGKEIDEFKVILKDDRTIINLMSDGLIVKQVDWKIASGAERGA